MERNFEGMRFCRECNNMLYPKEDKQNRVLLYACRNCDHSEEAARNDPTENCVYRNDISGVGAERYIVRPEIVTDPTLPRTKNANCPNECDKKEAVFFQAPSKGDEGMKLVFVCTTCKTYWKE
eukprot:GILJ01007295.1.p1 GENE.GILJ01007295.1~~GILJ01007295.1.p1  ORF type:complete len:123 (+),score=11.48 GILJ01007295.1:29-397(+)